MDRRHLGAEDRVVFSHLLGEDHTVEAGGNDFSLLLFLFTGADGSQKRADTDTGSAQIADLIDLQAGIDLSGVGQNIFYLVGGNGVQTAAEGVQLDEIQIFRGLHIVGSGIETAVVHPLVHDDEGTLRLIEVGDGVLGKNGHAVGIDELRNTVVDLGIHMVGSSCQNDAVAVVVLQPF